MIDELKHDGDHLLMLCPNLTKFEIRGNKMVHIGQDQHNLKLQFSLTEQGKLLEQQLGHIEATVY